MDFHGKRAALHTLGCKVNEYESDAMRSTLEEAGFTIVPFSEPADVCVINTCSVTNIADRKSRQMISRAKKKNPDAVVVAAGCYVQTALERTGKLVEADILIGTGQKSHLVEELERYFEAMERAKDHMDLVKEPVGTGKASQHCVIDVMHEKEYEELSLPRIEGHTRAWIKVQDGCNMFCSYCIIPFARGRIRSRRMEDVLEELQRLADQGICEVVLTGIHLSSYGVDFAGDIDLAYGENGEKKTWQERSKLIDLIEAVSRIRGIERIRLGSLEPTVITEEFVRRLSAVKQVCPHFHLSLQSGCDSVLKRMNRHYTTREYKACVHLLREAFDEPAITTDVITGFPGESEEEFECTRQFLEEICFYETHLFRYSLRAGTRAARMPDQIPEKVKEERLEILAGTDRRMRKRFEDLWNGKKVQVLFEEVAQIDEHGCVSVPNSSPLGDIEWERSDLPEDQERLYTGYTKEYIRVYARCGEDLRGRIMEGKLQGLQIKNLQVCSCSGQL